jgi:hypothetical protein
MPELGNRVYEPRVTATCLAGQDPFAPSDSWEGTLRWGVGMGETGWA